MYPKEMMQQCKKCLLNETVQEIVFDNEGICNFCLTWKKLERQRQLEKANLPQIIEKIKKTGKGKDYDCLLGMSGGVDSSYLAHLIGQLGLRPLILKFNNHWNHQFADDNTKRITHTLHFPHFHYILNDQQNKIYKELQQAFLLAGVINIEIPTDHLLLAITYGTAAKFGIKYILSGGNHATEGIMPESWSYWSGDLKHIKAIYKQFTKKELKGLPVCGLLKWNWYKWIKRIKIINLLDYYEYNREEAISLLKEKYEYIEYGEKHCENIYTQWFQNCYLPIKFGIDKRKAHYSSLINSGQMTKEEAMKKMTESVKFRIVIPPAEFVKYPIRSHYSYPNNEKLYKFLCKMVFYIRKVRRHTSAGVGN